MASTKARLLKHNLLVFTEHMIAVFYLRNMASFGALMVRHSDKSPYLGFTFPMKQNLRQSYQIIKSLAVSVFFDLPFLGLWAVDSARVLQSAPAELPESSFSGQRW